MSDWGISSFYDSTFGATGFWTQGSPGLPVLDEEIAEYHHPGGDNNTLIKLGQKTPRMEIIVACNAASYAALASAQGSSATLTIPGMSGATATLLTVTPRRHEYYTAIYECRLVFAL